MIKVVQGLILRQQCLIMPAQHVVASGVLVLWSLLATATFGGKRGVGFHLKHIYTYSSHVGPGAENPGFESGVAKIAINSHDGRIGDPNMGSDGISGTEGLKKSCKNKARHLPAETSCVNC